MKGKLTRRPVHGLVGRRDGREMGSNNKLDSANQGVDNKPYNAFEHLWRSIFPISAKEKLIVMLTAYLDESGKDGRSPIFALAGYVSTIERWTEFQLEWNDFLDRNHIECFHAAEMENRYGEFKLWTPKRVQSAFRIADRIISKYVPFGAVTFADISECEKVVPLRSPSGSRGKYQLEYALSGCQVVNAIVAWAKAKGYTEAIKFVFEEGMKGQGKGQLMDALAYASKGEPMIGGVAFEKKCRDFPQLQAADRAVGLACKSYQSYLKDKNSASKERMQLARINIQKAHVFDSVSMPQLAERWGLDVYGDDSSHEKI